MSETIVDRLVESTVHLGIPNELLSDNKTNFTSKLMKQYCETVGIKQIKTSPYHPQSDGIVEHFNSTLKRLLWKLVQNPCCGGTQTWYTEQEDSHPRN